MELSTQNQVILNISPSVSIPHIHYRNTNQFNKNNCSYNLCNKCCKWFNKFMDLSLKIKIIIVLIILIILALLGFIVYISNEFIRVFSL